MTDPRFAGMPKSGGIYPPNNLTVSPPTIWVWSSSASPPIIWLWCASERRSLLELGEKKCSIFGDDLFFRSSLNLLIWKKFWSRFIPPMLKQGKIGVKLQIIPPNAQQRFAPLQIRKLMKNADFCNFMNPVDLCAWTAFTNVINSSCKKRRRPTMNNLLKYYSQISIYWVQNEHQVTFFAKPSRTFSRKSKWCERRARIALSSRHQRHGRSLSRSLECHHACRLLLVYQARRC